MRIVSQSASASYSHFPEQQPMLALPAPHIAGFLPARCASSPQIKVLKQPHRESLLDRQRAIWAVQDAELEEFLRGARQRIAAAFAESRPIAHVQPVQAVVMEVGCAS